MVEEKTVSLGLTIDVFSRSLQQTNLGLNHFNLVLTINRGPLSGNTLVVPIGEVRTVGRTNSSFFVTDDSFMSGVHFEVQNFGDYAEIRDKYSRNKTWLNSAAIAVAKLKSGDLIRAGKTDFLVQLEELPVELKKPEVERMESKDGKNFSPIGSSVVVFAPTGPAIVERVESKIEAGSASSSPFESVDHSFAPKNIQDDSNYVTAAKHIEAKLFSPFDSVRLSNEAPPPKNSDPPPVCEAKRDSTASQVSIRRLKLQCSSSVDFDFCEFIERLAKTEQIKIVAHFRKIGLPTPETLHGLPVYPQLPSSEPFLPVIVDQAEWLSGDGRAITNRLLRSDAIMIAILNDSEGRSSALQELSASEVAGFSEKNGFLTWYWPSQLHTLFESLSDSEVGMLLRDSIKGFIYAAPQVDFKLQACVNSCLEEVLAEFGFE